LKKAVGSNSVPKLKSNGNCSKLFINNRLKNNSYIITIKTSSMLLKKTALHTFLSGTAAILLFACNSSQTPDKGKKEDITQYREKETQDLAVRGKFLVAVAGCSDCHSPKNMTAQGPVADSSKLFSGHPAQFPLTPFDPKGLTPGNWMQMEPDLTAYAGPWGVSFSANLTPDSTTGLGAWTEDIFIKTMRTRRHLGQENGRPLLPPMPDLGHLQDDDLRAIFAYLHSLPAVKNQVPAPLSPQEALEALKKM
jgi:cytochrome c553